MTSLSDRKIFRLRPVLQKFTTKKSAFVVDAFGRPTLCLVGHNNTLLFHVVLDGANDNRTILKLVYWFHNAGKCIQDVSFDPSGSMLLILCYDNTLHTVPVYWVLYRTTAFENFHVASDMITSFIVPFAGPHECPNSKTCPNNGINAVDDSTSRDRLSSADSATDTFSPHGINDLVASENLYNTFYFKVETPVDNNNATENALESDITTSSCTEPTATEDYIKTNPCPYPTSVVWWRTLEGKHCAIIGYSDGSICIVGLRPNCPLISNTYIERGAITYMVICTDSILNNVTLMINSSLKEQWKLLLEQKSIGYVFPGDTNKHRISAPNSKSSSEEASSSSSIPSKVADDDWQIVFPLKTVTDEAQSRSTVLHATPAADDAKLPADDDVVVVDMDIDAAKVDSAKCTSDGMSAMASLLPATRARLVSLRELGAKKIGALKLKLAENKIKTNEKDRTNEQLSGFAIMDVPAMLPEILTTPAGPFFIVQFLKDTYLLSALHAYSDTLSVHSMDISLMPLYIYKIPKNCTDILVTPNLLYTIQTVCDGGSTVPAMSSDQSVGLAAGENIQNAIGVVASNTTELRIGEDAEFSKTSQLSLFHFKNETIIAVYRSNETITATSDCRKMPPSLQNNKTYFKHLKLTQNYTKNRRKFDESDDVMDDRRWLRTEFPTIEMNKCMVVTDRNVYMIELKDTPENLFMAVARTGQFNICEEFCKIFNLNFPMCIEFVGDEFLRVKKTKFALQCYNIARIPSVKTALKLATSGDNNALMHLCAMALKTVYILKSVYPISHHIQYLQHTDEYQNTTNQKNMIAPPSRRALLSGVSCSGYSYEKDEAATDLQMSNSSQFHLSNLLLLTLAEKTIKEKSFMPLWNFLVSNKKYHPNMTSIVLCQSGLYSSAVLLACARGAHLDAYCGLVGVCNQEFGWYNELNKILLSLSDIMFMECIIYMYTVSLDYFKVVQNKIGIINIEILEKLKSQLNPFSPVFRPVVSQFSATSIEANSNEIDSDFVKFCKTFIETFIMIIIRIYTSKTANDSFVNALSSITINHEDKQFAINVRKSSPLSAGFSHCACIVDGIVYVWGSNGINCLLSNNAQSDAGDLYSSPRPLQLICNMGLIVHAVRCARTHTLILTNNGLYATGANQLGQLGVGKYTAQALQPMIVREFDGKDVTLIEAGQYHNAVVADGILYTWGWGLYGQLGHGDVEDVYKPQKVNFFIGKKIKQIALGYAHTLILAGATGRPDHLYVFGSNHYGQLGVGQKYPATDDNDPKHHNNFMKSLVPIILPVVDNIRLIHTKFFTNFIVTEDNRLLVWGASPQALRLEYQAKKRAKAAQKQEAAERNMVPPPPPTIDNNPTVVKIEAPASDDSAPAEPMDVSETDVCSTTKANAMADAKPRSKSLNDLSGIQLTVADDSEMDGEPKRTQSKQKPSSGGSFEEESSDHMYPVWVDTGAVDGVIVQVSSGLYHNALVTEHRKLYTWGKNLEKQLGRDRSQFECIAPTLLETVEEAVHVECGADFTLLLTSNMSVKAFGNNSYGQCGRDVTSDKNGIMGKLVRMRVSKRVVRIPDSTQCLELPVDINLPQPRINLDFEPVRYVKSVPSFYRRFVRKSDLFTKSKTSKKPQVNDELINSLYQLSLHECNQNVSNECSGDKSPDDIIAQLVMDSGSPALDDVAAYMSPEDRYPNEFIHYCLFIFHGIYNPNRMLELVAQKEFRVRILMLNYRIKEAFSLCISDTVNTGQAIKTFEYFTKDSNVIPIHREDLKYLIYELFLHFISQASAVAEIEQFFLNDLDYYLFALAYVLYFNNNNTNVERQALAKYADLFGDDVRYGRDMDMLEKSELIFNAVSIVFKTIVCQKLFDYEDNFA